MNPLPGTTTSALRPSENSTSWSKAEGIRGAIWHYPKDQMDATFSCIASASGPLPTCKTATPIGACNNRHWWCHDSVAFSGLAHFFQWYLRRINTSFSSDNYQQMCIEIPPTFLEPGNFWEAWASSTVAAVPMIIQISLRAVPVNAHRRLLTEHKVWFIEL